MENLVYVINLLKKYDGFYFIKKSLCKNVYRKWLGIFTLVVYVSLFITIYFEKTYIYSILMVLITVLAFKLSNLMDKDHKDIINQPLGMEFFKYSYLMLRICMIKKTLQSENLYSEHFLDKTINECDTYLILESNKTSFILKHPLIIILIAIIGGYITNLIWANNSPNTLMIIIALLITIIQISPLLEDKCAKVRTVKFIIQTLRNQMS